MKQLVLMITVVMSQSVLGADKKPLIADPIVEKANSPRRNLQRSSQDPPIAMLTEESLYKSLLMQMLVLDRPHPDYFEKVAENPKGRVFKLNKQFRLTALPKWELLLIATKNHPVRLRAGGYEQKRIHGIR